MVQMAALQRVVCHTDKNGAAYNIDMSEQKSVRL